VRRFVIMLLRLQKVVRLQDQFTLSDGYIFRFSLHLLFRVSLSFDNLSTPVSYFPLHHFSCSVVSVWYVIRIEGDTIN
jgi:hypothetical protein